MFFSRIVGSGTPRRSQQAARGRFGRPWKFPGAHSGPVRGVPRPLGTAVCGNLFLRLASWKAVAKNTVVVGSPGASAPSGRRPARLGRRPVFFFPPQPPFGGLFGRIEGCSLRFCRLVLPSMLDLGIFARDPFLLEKRRLRVPRRRVAEGSRALSWQLRPDAPLIPLATVPVSALSWLPLSLSCMLRKLCMGPTRKCVLLGPRHTLVVRGPTFLEVLAFACFLASCGPCAGCRWLKRLAQKCAS